MFEYNCATPECVQSRPKTYDTWPIISLFVIVPSTSEITMWHVGSHLYLGGEDTRERM